MDKGIEIPLYTDYRLARQSLLLRKGFDPEDTPTALRESLRRLFGQELSPAEAVALVVKDVRQRGDAALLDWTKRLDSRELDRLEVPQAEWKAALDNVPSELAQALQTASARIADFHQRQKLSSWTTTELGGVLGQKVTPLRRVGIYVPGGTAPLPSSLLMSAIPARVAGVDEIVVCTPPTRGGDRLVPAAVLAAAQIAGIDRLFCVGGAQAIAALAYGTQTIPRVDKIAGPGGLFVTLAKRQLYGTVGLDGLYGPTETVIVADETANPAWVAADLLAQAEHDVLATAILLTPSSTLAEQVRLQVAEQAAQLERRDVLAVSLRGQSGIVLTPDLETAVRLADEFAPEHLCLLVRDPVSWAQQVRNAGGIFLGENSCEVLGDYVAGPSHVMPTGGTARFSSPLNVLDFLKISSIVGLDADSACRLADDAARVAQAESLTAHAAAALKRSSSK